MSKNIINKSKIFNPDNINPTPDYTFNRMRDLQVLLKKESSLKELCNYLIYIIFKKQ